MPRPKFGQVWDWDGVMMMLIAAGDPQYEAWETITLGTDQPSVAEWHGLGDDEQHPSWKLLSKEDE